MIYLDFETRSIVDLKTCGADVYARHPSTEILCMGYAVDDDDVKLWIPGDPLPDFKDMKFIAHNAAFEIAIWNFVATRRYDFPSITAENFTCTMAMSYAMALPGSLEKASAAVGIHDGKDMKGHRTMMLLSQPRDVKNDQITWWDDDEKKQKLYNYCLHDVKTERELYKRLVKLSDYERQVWLLDQEINQRGISVDMKAINAAISLVESEKKRLDALMQSVTENQVVSCSATAQLTQWLRLKGVEVESLAKAHLSDLLEKDLPVECRQALLLRQEAAKTSTAKLEAMRKSADQDGRIRGLTQYHGASTGRFAGRRLQVHNFPRNALSQDEIETVFKILDALC